MCRHALEVSFGMHFVDLSSPEAIQSRTPEAIQSRTPEAIQNPTPEAIQNRTPEAIQSRTPEAIQNPTPTLVPREASQEVECVSKPLFCAYRKSVHAKSKLNVQLTTLKQLIKTPS